jgi:hypothetical protein
VGKKNLFLSNKEEMACTGVKGVEKGGRGMGKMIKMLVPLEPYNARMMPGSVPV